MSAGHTEPATTAASPPDAEKLRVFLSYSRKDIEFVRNLADALAQRGYLADFDQSTHHAETGQTGIAPTDDWWMRLQDMIAAADVMVLVVSPDSAASKVVDEEIAYARSLSKRIIAITCREIDFNSAPPRLSALNVSHWFLKQDFASALEPLCISLDRDVEWLRASAGYTVEAKAWTTAGKPADRLLFGEEISTAEAWSARRPATAPEVSELVLEFLSASRTEQTRRERNQRNVRRVVVGLIAIAFAVAVAGGWFVLQGQRDLARQNSRFLATQASSASDAHQYDRALRLSLLAARDTWLAPASPEAEIELGRATHVSHLEAALLGHQGIVRSAVFSPDGSRILTASADRTARLWTRGPGGRWEVTTLEGHTGPVNSAVFSPDGARILTASGDKTARLWT